MPRSNKLVFLGIVTLLVVSAAVVTSRRHAPTTSTEKQYVFPGLTGRINEVARLEVSGKDGDLTITRKGEDWLIKQADDYPAAFDKVRQAAIAVAEAKIIAEKTADPNNYPKLGVEDPTADKSKSRLFTLYDAKGGKLASLIIGKRRMSSAAPDSHGYYIRLPAGAHALLVEGNLDIGAKTADWFDPDIIDIKPKHISAVVIEHPGEQPLKLTRAAAGDDFTLADIPPGKELQSSYTVNRIEDILNGVRAEDVRSADSFKFPEQQTVASVTTYDGLTAVITSATVDGADWSRFHFKFQAPAASTAADANTDNGKTESAGAGNDAVQATASPKEKADKLDGKLADALNRKTSGWVYKIPAYKSNLFTHKLKDLVKDKEPEKKENKEKN